MAMILDAFVGKFAQKLVELIQERAVTVLGVRDDLQHLRRRLAIIECVLADAEKRRIREKAIDVWVRQLKDVMYDADDMIDLCRIKGAQLLRDRPSSSSLTARRDLEDVGMQIVEKCRGLPLAIKAISGTLITRNANRREWELLLANEAWSMSELPEELRGALYLSYEDLPSPLKQCFLYLSLFPEDFVFYSNDIVRMWVAEGFVKPQGDSLLEDVGEGYFEELAKRNILQKTFGASDGILCKMHDLMRSLAQYLSRDESYFYGGSAENLDTIFATEFQVRRLACAVESTAVPKLMLHQRTLRTLLSFGASTMFRNDALVKLKYLRVLHLDESRIESLPDSIENLVHHRLLSLYGTSISMLPRGIVRLKNLQTLDLSYCESLHSLPSGITQLCNPRHLLLFGTPLSYRHRDGVGSLHFSYTNEPSGYKFIANL